MKRYLSVLGILLASLYVNDCSAQAIDSAGIISSLHKCWHAFSHEYSTIYGLEEEEIKRYSKQKVCFTRDSVSMYLGTVFAPTYAIKKVNAEDYAKTNFDCTKQRLGISMDSVFEVTITSHSKPAKDGTVHKMTDIIILGEECIYVTVDGVIFKLFDVNSKVQQRSSN